MGQGNKLTVISNIERWYLDFVRVLFAAAIVLAACAIVVAGIWYGSANVGTGARDFSDGFVTPDWDDVRRNVLPLLPMEQAPRSSQAPDSTPSRPALDPRIIEIADNLNLQFARNTGQETAFTDAYPRRALEAWINERAGVPAELRDDFVEALIEVSRGVGEDALINRIGSVTDRANTMRDALSAYRDEYLRLARTTRDEIEAANRARAAERETATTNALLLGAGGAAVMLSLVLVVVLMRIEVHLRRVER